MKRRKSNLSGKKFRYPGVREINSKVNKKILVNYADGGDIEVESDMLKQYKENLKNQENLGKKGWDSEKQLWFSTSAPEKNGGFDIGYGHKIQEGEDFSKGLTNDQVNALFTKDYNTKFKAAESTFNNSNLNKSWGDLTEAEQILLSDYQYNGVLGEFKNFMKAVADEDKETMLKEYERYSGGLTLGKRNDWTKLFIENNINYNSTETNLGEPVIEMIDMSNVPYTPKSILKTLTQAGSYPKKEYKIKEGDTFYGVANRLKDVTKEQLKTANPDIDINAIKPGQKISVPYTFPKSDKVDIPKMADGGNIPRLLRKNDPINLNFTSSTDAFAWQLNKAGLKNHTTPAYKQKMNELSKEESLYEDAAYNTLKKRGNEKGISMGGHNDIGDARRHAYTSLEVAKDKGIAFALAGGAYHELKNMMDSNDFRKNDYRENLMDMWNNTIGATIGGLPFIDEARKNKLLEKADHKGWLMDKPPFKTPQNTLKRAKSASNSQKDKIQEELFENMVKNLELDWDSFQEEDATLRMQKTVGVPQNAAKKLEQLKGFRNGGYLPKLKKNRK